MAGAAPTGKLQGFKSTFHYTPPGATAPVRFKSITGWDLSVESPQINVDDHDTNGWADTLPGLAKATVSLKAVYFEGDETQQQLLGTFFQALQATQGTVAVTLEPIDQAGGLVYQLNAIVTGFKHSAGNTDGQMYDITLINRGAVTIGTQSTTLP